MTSRHVEETASYKQTKLVQFAANKIFNFMSFFIQFHGIFYTNLSTMSKQTGKLNLQKIKAKMRVVTTIYAFL